LQAAVGTECAYELARLWKQSAQAKLLQQPPAATSSAKQSTLFELSIKCAEALQFGALTVNTVLRLQQKLPDDLQSFLPEVLASHAVATLAHLLVWLQQQPGLLQLPELAADEMACSGCHSHGALWLACNKGGPVPQKAASLMLPLG
jgi:hypothetical protein